MCYSGACAVGARKKEKDRGNLCRTPKSPRYIDLVEIITLMATVNWSCVKANIFVLLPSLEGVHCSALQLRSMKEVLQDQSIQSLVESSLNLGE